MDSVRKYTPELIDIRHQLHRNPELSREEYETSRLIRQELTRYGVEILEYGLDTGVVGLIQGKEPGRCPALREDIDALPIAERTGLVFTSEKEEISHACGHDIHTAVLLGCAKILMECRDAMKGSVLLVFQCAEEQCDGSVSMLQHGVMHNPKPDVVAGLHCSPGIDPGKIGVASRLRTYP